MIIPIICGSVFCLFGAFELIIFIVNKKYFDSKIEGVVIHMEKGAVTQEKGSFTQQLPVFRYVVDGKTYEQQVTPELHNESKYQIGQTSILKFNSKKPEIIIIENGKNPVLLYSAIILAGAVIILLASLGILHL